MCAQKKKKPVLMWSVRVSGGLVPGAVRIPPENVSEARTTTLLLLFVLSANLLLQAMF